MRNLWRFSGAFALLTLLAISTRVSAEEIGTPIPAEVRKIVDREISARFPGSFVEMQMLSAQFEDAGIDLPEESWNAIQQEDGNVDVGKNELGLLFTFTSPKHFNELFTHGNKKVDNLMQYTLRGARGDAIVRGLTKTVLANRTLPNYVRAVLWVKIRIPQGGYNPIRTDIVYRPELQASTDSLWRAIHKLNKRADDHEKKLAEHEKRIAYLENNMLSKNSLGFSVSLGYCSYDINDHTFRGPTVVVTGRYYDLAIEGYVSELFNDSQEMLKSSGNDLYLRFSDNNIRGGSIFWAPAQGEVPMWGKYWQLGVTGLYGDQSNIEHIASLYSYYAGPALKVFVPLKSAIRLPIVLEGFGTVGYGTTTMSATSYETAPTKSRGLGYGLRGALVIGRR